MPSDLVWSHLTVQHGRKSVMSLEIDEVRLDAETRRQIPLIETILAPLLPRDIGVALDYGCGYGRFSPMLADLANAPVIAYDPCAELIAKAKAHPRVRYFADARWGEYSYDLIFVGMVLGAPGLDVAAVAESIAERLAPTGLLVIMDHMPDRVPLGTWWRFRPVTLYQRLFGDLGLKMEAAGSLEQLDKPLTILVGGRG